MACSETRVHFNDEKVYTDILKPLREVRKIRQQPAHLVVKDEYDLDFINKQNSLVEQVHTALASLCVVFSTHPKAKENGYKLPDWLLENKVKTY